MRKNFFKQRVALFFGYKGTAFRGLQKQVASGVADETLPNTVELALETALFKEDFISEMNFGGEGDRLVYPQTSDLKSAPRGPPGQTKACTLLSTV